MSINTEFVKAYYTVYLLIYASKQNSLCLIWDGSKGWSR